MTKSAPALINPALLVWARETVGYDADEAALKIGVDTERLLDWETAVSKPSIAQLKIISRVYRRPFASFYLSERPEDIRPPRDYRRIHAAGEFKDVVTLNLAIRDVEFRREASIELTHLVGQTIPEFSYSLESNMGPEEAGNKIRDIIGISIQEQRTWRDPRIAFNAWRSLLERVGVLVCQFSGVSLEEVRGFSIAEFPLPAVAVNAKDAHAGRIFTLLHEFVHIMLRQSGTCDIFDGFRRTPDAQATEVYCNVVAASTLVPKTPFLESLIVDAISIQRIDQTLESMACEFSVSRLVILRRLYTFRKINQAVFEAKHQQLVEEHRQLAAAKLLKTKDKKVIISPTMKLFSNSGVKFVGLVMEALHTQAISLSDASDYFGVKLKHLPKIKTELERRWVDPIAPDQ